MGFLVGAIFVFRGCVSASFTYSYLCCSWVKLLMLFFQDNLCVIGFREILRVRMTTSWSKKGVGMNLVLQRLFVQSWSEHGWELEVCRVRVAVVGFWVWKQSVTFWLWMRFSSVRGFECVVTGGCLSSWGSSVQLISGKNSRVVEKDVRV